MNKITLSPRAKKIILFSGMAVACVGVLSVVLIKANAGTDSVATSAASSDANIALSSSGTVSIAPIIAVDSSESSTASGATFNPKTEKNVSEPLTTVSKPTSAPPKPTVEGESKNGQQPTNPALTDKSKKPTYTTQPKAPASYNSSSKPSSAASNSGTGSGSGNNGSSTKSNGGSAGGGSHDGQVYVDGFGWVNKPQGDGKYTTVGNPGDKLTGDKVGSMD